MKAPLTSMATDVLNVLNDGGKSLRPCRRSVFELVAATGLPRPAVISALWELEDRGLSEAVEWRAVVERDA